MRRLLLALGVAAALVACDSDGDDATTGVRPAPVGAPWATLSEWGLFADAATQTPADRVVPYDVNAPLFSDYALKHRFIWVPEGLRIGYEVPGAWDLPVGSIVVKTFALPVDARDPAAGEQLLETRLLVHEPDGWNALTYVYDPATPGEALLKKAGAIIDATWIDGDGATRTNQYVVPTQSECRECHGAAPDTHLLGVKTLQLDREGSYDGASVNQIAQLEATFGFDVPPPAPAAREAMPDPFGDGPLYDRARAYLDANCAHCHSATGDQSQKTLNLDWPSTDPTVGAPVDVGVCKVPTSAGGATCGLTYDIVPGDPDASVMVCRIESTERQVQMPPLGRNLEHSEAAALIRAWIADMPAADCSQ